MRANNDRLIVGAMRAARRRDGSLDDQPALVVSVSCVGRRLVLGERTEEEVETTLEALPAGPLTSASIPTARSRRRIRPMRTAQPDHDGDGLP